MNRSNPRNRRDGNNTDQHWRNRKKNHGAAGEPGSSNGSNHQPSRGNRYQWSNRPNRPQIQGRGNNRRPNNINPNRTQYFTFTRLDQLSKMNSDDVVATLADKKTEFAELLCSVIAPDHLVLTLRVLINICQANFNEIVTCVLSHACSPNFLKTLEAYLTKLPFESAMEKMKNKLYHEDKNGFWSNLIEFFKKVTQLLPNKARDELMGILQKIDSISTIIETSQGYKIEKKIKDDAQNLFEELENEVRKLEEKNKIRSKTSNEADVEENPPEDFRLLSVIPTVEDLFNNKPFIRPCIIKDRYNSVEHYLDVQFRLLREDFISPLRSGIQEYLHGEQKHRNNELRIYRKVRLITPQVANKCLRIGVSFGVIKHIQWARSKRFMYGGLLLLSSDNFNTISFVTVSDRNEEMLKQGYVLIEPCLGTKITRDMYNNNFVMLESKIYFEPYLAVLTAMQHMNVENFPMERYLVNADTETVLPKYLEHGDVLEYKDMELPIGEDQIWPTAEEMKLDETQYSAFKCALTQEFAVIQGPPGTGKTFIALEIVRTLLQNKRNWQQYGPIVVVCLTNHALDQFLEGILKYTKSIVRVGSRSKSETLKEYTLMERRKLIHSYDRSDAWYVMNKTKNELEDILSSIEKVRLFVKYLTTPDAIVPLRCLQNYCQDKTLTAIQSNEELVNWLIGSNITLFPESSPLPPENQDNLTEIIPEDIFEDAQHRQMDDELELNYKFKVDDSEKLIFPLKSMDALINKIHQDILEYRSWSGEALPFDPTIEWEEDLQMLNEQRMSLQRKLSQHSVLTEQRYPPNNLRWRLYWRWVRISHDSAMIELGTMETSYRRINLQLHEAKQLVDLSVLREHKIIGLTTSAAAKLHASLRALCAPIVLVEEAAEILEAHVVCSMTKDCQHVILIGDHKQLRPKASVYKLGTKYNLNISLFERMVNIRGDCTQLAHQHRMRPQIAALITPSIYEKLYNHESVLEYPSVRGLEKNLFFLNHENRESSHDNEESWVNKHEATFMIAFARHLVLQGYEGAEITILCMYTGQLFALMQEARRYTLLSRVRITSVDNYQGEENRIILLSLVRNNGEGNIGFLKEENRVCVALSRAREGLYVMGNMDDLIVKNEIWPKIRKVLEDQNAIGDSLEFRCQVHSDQSIKIKTLNDFQQCPEGGCLKTCEIDLPCGHACTSVCHVSDRDHEEYECKQPCIKRCPNDDPCPLKCYQGCKPCAVMKERQLKCGHTGRMQCSTDPEKFNCRVQVDAILPDCNHEIKKDCCRSLELCRCPHPCETRLPCGHTCNLTCHVKRDPDHIEYLCYRDCTKNNLNCMNEHPCKKRCHEECVPCPIIVEKTRSCGHYYKQIQCAINVEYIECLRPCKRIMSCGHQCRQKCYEDCKNCQEQVKKTSSCGHILSVKCCEEATPAKCNSKCQRKLACGHPCTAKCKEQCTLVCKTMVRQSMPGLCGHIFSVPCYLTKNPPDSRELLTYCKEPCGATLTCDHRCGGKCGSCKQGRIHIPCCEPCGNTLICGHACNVPCRQECPPCTQRCEVRCRHNKCNKKCGMPCALCKEWCQWGCEHRRCTKRCHELCDIEPCNEPCKKMLKCKHPCVGFCGEPCPPLCRICHEEELTTIFFGAEDEPDARFVFLKDCGHCIESEALSTWLMKSDGSVQIKVCPKCKTPIRKCMRIMNQIKEDLNDVMLVKKKLFGNQATLKKQYSKNQETIQNLLTDVVSEGFPELGILLQKLWDNGISVKNRKHQFLNAREVEALRIALDMVRQMFDILESIKKRNISSYKHVESQVAMIVESIPKRGQISKQEHEDIGRELDRLNYMAEACKIDATVINDSMCTAEKNRNDALITKLLSIGRFTKTTELEVREEIISLQNSLKNNTFKERAMIVKAMGFNKGHWFKCPNGHFYTIGECGGAMQESRCHECGATIGGGSHRLTAGNSLAPEMDGATHSAWPGPGM